MRVNNYFSPATLDEALHCMREPGLVKALAGGTDLNIALHEREIRPDAIVDLTHIPELKKIEFSDGVLTVGSMVTFTEAQNSELVNQYCPLLAMAASTVGSPQIRNSGTIGGNLANAATAADSVPTMMAMDADVVVRNEDGERILKATEIPTGLNKTCLAPDELIVEFRIKPTTGKFVAFEKIGRRKALAISRINMAMVLDLDGNTIKAASIAFGAVGKTAYRVTELEKFLTGREITEELLAEAGDKIEAIVTEVLAGRSTTPYKKKIAAAVLKRGLEKAMGGAAS